MFCDNNGTTVINGVINIYHDKRTCHGCSGRGWVETLKGAERCPVCLGAGIYPPPPQKLEVICTDSGWVPMYAQRWISSALI